MIGKLIKEGIEPPVHLEPDILIEGAVHWIHGTADTGKTWLAAYIVKQRIEAGENVIGQRSTASGWSCWAANRTP